MDPRTLTLKLEAIPRVRLAEYPTPLEPLPRLSQELRRQVFVKRDDVLGPAMGGNKTRKLEYLLAEAQQHRMRKVVTFGGLQSNHARLTAAACARLGIACHLFYFERRPASLKGNLLLNHLLGARLHFIPLGGAGGGMTLEQTIRLVRLVAWIRLGPHYFIPVGGHSCTGCLGYVRAALEIDAQARQMGIENACLVTAAGSGGTLAGLLAGLRLLKSPLNVWGVDVGKLWRLFPASIGRLAEELCARLGQPEQFPAEAVPLVAERFAGPAYATPTPESQAALRRLARLEGLLLDPVYTSKAFAGLLVLAGEGQLGRDEPLIFLHTGGSPALFVPEQWLAENA